MFEWFGELKGVFGAAAAIVIGMLLSTVIYVVKKWNAEQAAHHLTKDQNAKALEVINDKSADALLKNAVNTAQMTEVIRQITDMLRLRNGGQ